MSRHLLDTDVLIGFSKGREPALSFIRRAVAAGDELGVTAVNVAEFYAGLPPPDHRTWDEFFEPLEFWAISRAAARQAGILRYELAGQGTPLQTTDLLVAAVAVEQQAQIVTANVKDFPMADVRLLPVSKAP